MTVSWKSLTQRLGKPNNRPLPSSDTPATGRPVHGQVRSLDISSSDPLVSLLLRSPSPIEVDALDLDSPTLRQLKSAGVKIAVPLVSQGELIGLLNLGPRLSEQDYSADDKSLLTNLATQAAPAVRVAQLVRQRQTEALELERMEQELRVARLIQQTLLPKELPTIPGWELGVHYQPAREVGGDFYDFFVRPDGRLAVVVGDVTDKGVPAALVMATTRATLRGAMRRMLSPGIALERSNNLLCPEVPPNMFITCLYAIIDVKTGRIVYANAGHDLPIRRRANGVTEFHATGMPLGLLPDMKYEEKEDVLAPGDSLLLYSDGLVEAHNKQREMFGFPRLRAIMSRIGDSQDLIRSLLKELTDFTGTGWEQEDDVTLLTLLRCRTEDSLMTIEEPDDLEHVYEPSNGNSWQRLVDFSLPSEPGKEYEAMKVVADAAEMVGMAPARLEKLKTAVAEATMNAMEHGNNFDHNLPVSIRMMSSKQEVIVYITDQGGTRPIPTPNTPNLEAKLDGLESPRGWGLFLIKNLVDEMRIVSDERHHTVELIMRLREGTDAGSGT